jgi:hypothetical protein
MVMYNALPKGETMQRWIVVLVLVMLISATLAGAEPVLKFVVSGGETYLISPAYVTAVLLTAKESAAKRVTVYFEAIAGPVVVMDFNSWDDAVKCFNQIEQALKQLK